MDHFAGLDVSVKDTSICIVDDTGKIVREAKVASEPEALLMVLKNPAYRQQKLTYVLHHKMFSANGRANIVFGQNWYSQGREPSGNMRRRHFFAVAVTALVALWEIPEARAAEPLPLAREAALNTKDSFKECLSCPEMIVVRSGEFLMGTAEDERLRYNDEGPQHGVKIGTPLAISKFEVTFDEWDACFKRGGCNSKGNDQGWGRGRQPVINVSWNDAREYVAWLSKETGKPYRLLSEAEWEYAARAGTGAGAYWWGEMPCAGGGWSALALCGPNAFLIKQPAPVGSYLPNPFGLYDMNGNVWEWVQDCYRENYLGAPADGSAWENKVGCRRVLRGGSWLSNSTANLRSAVRLDYTANRRADFIGFRIARALAR